MLRRLPNLTRSFTTKTVKGFTGAIGNTPLVRLVHSRTLCNWNEFSPSHLTAQIGSYF